MDQGLLHQIEYEPKCSCCSSRRLRWSALLLSLFAVGVLLCGTFVPPLVDRALDEGISDFLSLAPEAQRENSAGFRTWRDWTDEDASPVYMAVYMLNLTNPQQLLDEPVTKPVVTQHGPYVYREFRRKFDLEYGADYDNRQTLSYREWTWWEFDRARTPAELDPALDRYTTFNLAFQGVLHAVKDLAWAVWPEVQKNCPGLYDAEFDRMFVTERSVEEVLFGYEECVMSLAPPSGITPAGHFPGVLGTNLPPSANVTQEFIGNHTAPDTIYTGADEADLARQYLAWKGQTFLKATIGLAEEDIWATPDANRVRGTEGNQFKRDLKEGSTVTVLVEQLSRHAPLRNVNNEKIKLHGIEMLRYRLDESMLQNAELNPANAAYYMNVTGLLDVSRSKQKLPIFLSKPAFLDADPSLLEDVVGLVPDRERHDTTLDIEPLTGATMRARKRLQVNLRTSPFRFGRPLQEDEVWFPNLGTHYVPLAWIDQNGEISADKAKDFRSSVYGAQTISHYVRLVGSIAGSVLVALAGLLFFVAISRAEREQQIKSAILNRY